MQSRPPATFPQPVPWRFAALLVAWLLSWQSWGFALMAAGQAAAASCCCAHKNEFKVCHCRACTHAREVASGEPRMKECASGSVQAAVESVRVALPRIVLADPPVLPAPLPEAGPLLPLDSPAREVPTPPPLG